MWMRRLAFMTGGCLLLLAVTLSISSSAVEAQIGPRRTPDATRSGGAGQGEGGAGLALTPGAMAGGNGNAALRLTPGAFATPEGGFPQVGEITPSGLAQDIQLTLTALPFEFSLTALPQQVSVSSETAYNAIVGFASQHLWIAVNPILALEIPSASTGGTQGATASVDQLLTQFPAELQTVLASAGTMSATGYFGVFTDGAAVVYVGRCSDPTLCSTTIDSLQFQITNASIGAYSLYVPGIAPASASEALNIVTAVFPALASVGLTETTAQQGYAFTAVGTTINPQAISIVTVYYAGVMSVNTQAGAQSLVYALVGIGEGYASLVR